MVRHGAKEKCTKKPSSDAGRKEMKSGDGAGRGGINDLYRGLEGISLSSSEPRRLHDVSSLLFHSKSNKLPFRLPFLGPISLAEQGSIGAEISHGRGLITTRDVSMGECLFVVPPVFSADAVEVRSRYLQDKLEYGGDEARAVERLAEDQIVQKVQSACNLLSDEGIRSKSSADRARMQAFISQMSSERVPTIRNPDALMSVLVANESPSIPHNDIANLDIDNILSIIRRNAFGPDFHSYDKIAKCWTERANSECCYDRLLGIYPLAAMINHSCCPNAVRVFGCIPALNGKTSEREVMIVHASANIPKGTEITWSYLSPATPFAIRRGMLSSKYGFTCQCTRCAKEEEALSIAELQGLFALADEGWSSRGTIRCDQGEEKLVSSIERIFSTKQVPIESQRYLRVGFALLYIDYFNAAHSLENDESIERKLRIAAQLHFSFVSCNNASTEHLSILHLCYDLSSHMRSTAMKGNDPNVIARATSQVRFWTDQLKIAHMIRFGELGQDLENVRNAMKHSKLVLRNQDGWYLAKDRFI